MTTPKKTVKTFEERYKDFLLALPKRVSPTAIAMFRRFIIDEKNNSFIEGQETLEREDY